MKNIKIIIVLLLSVYSTDCYSEITDITPFIYDMKGVNAYDNVVVAYGNGGMISLSYDDGQSWEDVNVSSNENIINLISTEDLLIAFLENGIIRTSLDKGHSWIERVDINDTIIAAYSNEQNLVIKTRNGLYVLNNKFEIQANIELESNFYYEYESIIQYRNQTTLQIIDNKIYTFLNSEVLIYNLELELLETISVENSEFRIHKLFVIENNIYVQNSGELIEFDKERNSRVFLSDDDGLNSFEESEPTIYYLKLFGNTLYSFNAKQSTTSFPIYGIYSIDSKPNAVRIGTADCSSDKKNFTINDIAKFENNFYFVANNRFIVKYNSKSDETEKITDFSNFTKRAGYLPLRIENDMGLYRNNNKYYEVEPRTNKVNKLTTDSNFTPNSILYEEYNLDSKIITVLGYNQANKQELLLYTSNDLGNNFSIDTISGYAALDLTQITGFKKLDDGYMIASHLKTLISQKSELKFFDDDLTMLSNTIDSTKTNLKLGLIDGIFYRINQDTSFFKQTYLQTSPDGENWNNLTIYSHSDADTVWSNGKPVHTFSTPDFRISKEVNSNDVSFLINFLYSEDDSLFTVEKIDVSTQDIDTLIYNKIETLDYGVGDAFDLFKDTMNIVVNDTLYLLNVNDDKSKMEKIVFPDKGAVVQRLFRRFESKSFFTYFSSNFDLENYWFQVNKDSSITNVKINSDIDKYFYQSLPYPQPTNNIVNVEIFHDVDIDLLHDEIGIYNIQGNKVENAENIEINGSKWPSTITWDSSNQPKGIYFIVLYYAGHTESIKIIKK